VGPGGLEPLRTHRPQSSGYFLTTPSSPTAVPFRRRVVCPFRERQLERDSAGRDLLRHFSPLQVMVADLTTLQAYSQALRVRRGMVAVSASATPDRCCEHGAAIVNTAVHFEALQRSRRCRRFQDAVLEGGGIMRISERQVGNAVVLELVGPLYGWQAAGAVEETVRRHRRAGTRTLVVNLARVPSVDCGGLGALVDGYNAMREGGGEIRLACLTKRISDLLVITRLLTVFDAFDSVERALEGPMPERSRVTSTRPSPLSVAMAWRLLRRA
jgi:anti-sigma B factor antagonist